MNCLAKSTAYAAILGVGVVAFAPSSLAVGGVTQLESGICIGFDCNAGFALLRNVAVAGEHVFFHAGDDEMPLGFTYKLVQSKGVHEFAFNTPTWSYLPESLQLAQAERGGAATQLLKRTHPDTSSSFNLMIGNPPAFTVARQVKSTLAGEQASTSVFASLIPARPAALFFGCGLIGLGLLSRGRRKRLGSGPVGGNSSNRKW